MDFAGGKDFNKNDLNSIKDVIEKHVGKRYGLEISVKEPKDFHSDTEKGGVQVSRWQLSITTDPEKRDIPKQRIKIEIVNIPAYTRTLMQVNMNYFFLPAGYESILIQTETVNEILADKLLAFVACQSHIRYRDLWDFYWLRTQHAILDLDLVSKKIRDYNVVGYKKSLESTISKLNTTIHSDAFLNEMTHFIPSDTLEKTLQRPEFLEMLYNLVHDHLKLLDKHLP